MKKIFKLLWIIAIPVILLPLAITGQNIENDIPLSFLEYYFDQDPGLGNGIREELAPIPSSMVNLYPDLTGLENGFHTIYFRVFDFYGRPSLVAKRDFYKESVNFDTPYDITYLEYFVDDDPGLEAGTEIPIISDTSLTADFMVPTSELGIGFHKLYLRCRNSSGLWSLISIRDFYVDRLSSMMPPNLATLSYYIDAPDNGTYQSLQLDQNINIEKSFVVDLTNIPDGTHKLYLFSFDAEGNKSHIAIKDFVKITVPVNETPDIVKMEYFIDADSGYGKNIDIPVTPAGQQDISFVVPLSDVSEGYHILYVRSLDELGRWSLNTVRPFLVQKLPIESIPDIAKLEYYFTGVNYTSPLYEFIGFTPGTNQAITFSAFLTDLTPEETYNIHIYGINEFGVKSQEVIAEFTVETGSVYRDIIINEGWNIVSLPLQTETSSVTEIFPEAVSSAFGFEGGYFPTDSLEPGAGYWLKFAAADTINLEGTFIDSTKISVNTGWNIVGPFSENIAVSSITTNPAGIIGSNFFGFNNGYIIADSLFSGKGYWIKSTETGILQLNAQKLAKKIVKETLPVIAISDSKGKSFSLFAGNSDSYRELPPPAPDAGFDARFSDDTFIKDIRSTPGYLKISNAEYPVTITSDEIDLKFIIDGTPYFLKAGEQFVLTEKASGHILVEETVIPDNYSLSQNYPNPFNPETIIRFGLPEQTKVTLEVYNILGERVDILVNDVLEPGYHQVKFGNSNIASGVYIYNLRTNSFSSTKKMMLMK